MQSNRKTEKVQISAKELKTRLKLIGSLNRTGMNAGNKGDFEAAIGNLQDAISLCEILDKSCLTAKLLNNLGILYTQFGAWDKAMLSYEQSMTIVTSRYGTGNFLYQTLQKNISHLLGVDLQSNLA